MVTWCQRRSLHHRCRRMTSTLATSLSVLLLLLLSWRRQTLCRPLHATQPASRSVTDCRRTGGSQRRRESCNTARLVLCVHSVDTLFVVDSPVLGVLSVWRHEFEEWHPPFKNPALRIPKINICSTWANSNNSRKWPVKHVFCNSSFGCSTHTGQTYYLADFIDTYEPPRCLRSTNCHLLAVPSCVKSSFASRAFWVSLPNNWNSLPLHIRSSDSLATFQSRLKSHLFSSAYHV